MTRLAFILCLLFPIAAVAQPVPPKTVEDRVAALEKLRKQIDDLETQYAKDATDLDAALADLQKRRDDLKNRPIPVPPKPVPVPDPAFVTALKAAYAAETSLTKAADLESLKSLYRATAVAAGSAKDWGALFAAMGATAKELGLTGKLQGVQQVVSRELVRLTVNPRERPEEKVTDEHRAALGLIVKALEKLP